MSIYTYPYVEQKTTDIEYTLLYRNAFINNGILSKTLTDELKVSRKSATLEFIVNAGSLVVNGFCFIKDDTNADNVVLPSENGTYYIVVRVHQTAIPNVPRAELIYTKTIKQEKTGDFDYSLATVVLNGASVSILDTRTTCFLTADDVPELDTSKITTGIFDVNRIPNLDADKITTGVFELARIPVLDTSRIPNLDASKITSGTLAKARIPVSDIVKGNTPYWICHDTKEFGSTHDAGTHFKFTFDANAPNTPNVILSSNKKCHITSTFVNVVNIEIDEQYVSGDVIKMQAMSGGYSASFS
jgi:hypothetical protein